MFGYFMVNLFPPRLMRFLLYLFWLRLVGLGLLQFSASFGFSFSIGFAGLIRLPPYWCYQRLQVTSSPPLASGSPRQISLIASLRERFRLAEQNRDGKAKQALFREAIYLGIQPQLFTEIH